MKICIISENSYPVNTGGVSEWCHSLVSELSETNFDILTIAPNKKQYYETPENVDVKIIKMNQPTFDSNVKKNHSVERILETLEPVLTGKSLDCKKISTLMSSEAVSSKELISSKENQKVLLKYYKQNYLGKPFAPFYYSWMSLFYLLYKTLEMVDEVPETDLFHALNSGYAGLLGSICKASTGTPLLINEHGLYLKERLFELEHSEVPRWLRGFYEVFFNSLVRTSYIYSDQVASVCRDHVSYQKKISKNVDPIIVYNGIDVNKFSYDFKEEDDTLSVGTVSRITPIKDQLTLIRSIPEVIEKNDATFYIVGDVQDKEYYFEFLSLAESLGISERIEFTGFQESSEWYPQFDVFVLPSLSEGFPLTILEALSTGTPCIATNVGGVSEILDERFLINKWDPSALAGKINWLLQDYDLRSKIAQNGRRMIKNRFSIDQMVSSYKELYEVII